jgi:hypothetical protein
LMCTGMSLLHVSRAKRFPLQHWNVYKKWNERLFQEMYSAYENGRAEKDPSLGWYGGELWFYDNYVIPLSKKLEECGVFGVSSDECLSYALMNRKEWERTGKEIVQEMVDRYKKRKTLDIGGFSVDDINALSSKELANILDALIQKGETVELIKESITIWFSPDVLFIFV